MILASFLISFDSFNALIINPCVSCTCLGHTVCPRFCPPSNVWAPFCYRPLQGWWSPITLWRFRLQLIVCLLCTQCWLEEGLYTLFILICWQNAMHWQYTLIHKCSKRLCNTIWLLNMSSVCHLTGVTSPRMHLFQGLLSTPLKLLSQPSTPSALRLTFAHIHRDRPLLCPCSTIGRYTTSYRTKCKIWQKKHSVQRTHQIFVCHPHWSRVYSPHMHQRSRSCSRVTNLAHTSVTLAKSLLMWSRVECWVIKF